MDFPSGPPLPLFVHTFSRWGPGMEYRVAAAGTITPASMTWVGANTAYYFPVALPWAYPVKRVFWINGSSVTSTNMDMGIYTADGTLLYSTGSTAASGANLPQYVTAERVLSPGRYYFALADSSVTANRGGYGGSGLTASKLREAGVVQQASALPLPAAMTPATCTGTIYTIFGVTRTTTGF